MCSCNQFWASHTVFSPPMCRSRSKCKHLTLNTFMREERKGADRELRNNGFYIFDQMCTPLTASITQCIITYSFTVYGLLQLNGIRQLTRRGGNGFLLSFAFVIVVSYGSNSQLGGLDDDIAMVSRVVGYRR